MSLKHDLHLHLFGCLTAEDVWKWGQSRWQQLRDRLDWYADEYFKTCGQRPAYIDYWTKDDGHERLATDYEVKRPVTFPEFQARFNLLIALAGNRESDEDILHLVMNRHFHEGLVYAEYRLPSPRGASKSAKHQYWQRLAKTVNTLNSKFSGEFVGKLVVTLLRDPEHYPQAYRDLKESLRTSPDIADAIVGIDFCMDEEPYPPSEKRLFISKVLADNAADPKTSLALLYHVGESFRTISVESSMRWVAEVAAMSAHRLGHAISLGFPLESLNGMSILEPKRERLAHLEWLLNNEHQLQNYGYTFDRHKVTRELTNLRNSAEFTVKRFYDELGITEARSLQRAIRRWLADQKTIIECCPTSNFMIGNITDLNTHPSLAFHQDGLSLIVGADDPGIFACTLANEATLLSTQLGFTEAALGDLEARASRSKSPILAGRAEW